MAIILQSILMVMFYYTQIFSQRYVYNVFIVTYAIL